MRTTIIGIILFVIFGGSFFIFQRFSFSSKTKLKVMAYPSFLSPYGPASEIKKQFEEICHCAIQWMKVEDSTLMVQRLQLRSDGLGVDVVLGLDQLTLRLAQKEWKWENMTISQNNFIPQAIKWIHSWTAPISWSPLTFISRKQDYLPDRFQSLLDLKWRKKVSLPHPRSSTLGLQFYFWLFSYFDQDNRLKFLNSFKNQIYTLSHSWSSSYGLFQKEYVDLTFSYQTSVIYHLLEEDKKYFTAQFFSGHPYQVEYVAIPSTCKECSLAHQFIQFLLKEDIQKILMMKNYMFPVIQNVTQGTPFENLKKLPLISYERMDEFLLEKNKLLKEWEKIFY